MNDVKAVRLTAAGAAFAGRARLRGFVYTTSATAGQVTFTDGDGGTTVLDVDALGSSSDDRFIPDMGILCADGIYLSALPTGAKVTVYYS